MKTGEECRLNKEKHNNDHTTPNAFVKKNIQCEYTSTSTTSNRLCDFELVVGEINCWLKLKLEIYTNKRYFLCNFCSF